MENKINNSTVVIDITNRGAEELSDQTLRLICVQLLMKNECNVSAMLIGEFSDCLFKYIRENKVKF
ncbi:MAG: hypothetical protein LBS34_01400 [Rickettsiales bacterium]|jgi:hypothetical protein|nr:hypothetical protein [Rickettsiales bacterium]